MAIGANWAEVWASVWGPVWTQEAAEPSSWTAAGNSGGLVVSADGVIGSVFLSDVESVPGTATFHAGFAHDADGRIYVSAWPSSGEVVYIWGIARRHDGAMCIATSGDVDAFVNGWALTARGEVLVTTDSAEVFKSGIGQLATGQVCMQEVS